ncbi:Transcriptional factor B3 family protein / auxin-responsive factor AUX/IAA-related isoform 4 [Hibiscus syriacus]|uniref:Transcriptional factor B3 family protein / auxin-responsive factor AUX/IAA-related isoform 4 n=1 Tax=Hibiscus syriacus TaxID=106335 RepID=A0A6A3C7L3_HIBSY|nr:Transcriptional factor B3 family protein / auxin-responsive factor AUX/IAA-related isoform 4 [Hibiscus syriacus]
MGCLIDLNTSEEDELPSCCSLSPSSVLSASGFSSSICLELWHACAGPLISLPKRGSLVVYFPQGHLEQVPGFSGLASVYDLPPHVLCRVVDVKLHAEGSTDEVCAQVSLVPENEQIEPMLQNGKMEADGDEEDAEADIKSTTPHMFCKTLTASDTRQPQRHFLTSGWSAFVNKKKLVSGDAVLFIRGEYGELSLGIGRVAQIKNGLSFPSLCSKQLNHNTFVDVVHAVSVKSVFSIYYRASSLEFILPIRKFRKSLDSSFSFGMRFKMRFEIEDAAERRNIGVIMGISDLDPVRWPGSKWRWDDIDANKHGRVSPWEIEPSDSICSSNNLQSPDSKRNRIGLPSGEPEFIVPDRFCIAKSLSCVMQLYLIWSFLLTYGIGASDFTEPFRFQMVLQGQEIFVSSPYEKGSSAEETRGNESPSVIPNVGQLFGTRSGWSSSTQGYTTHSPIQPSAAFAQVSSLSSGSLDGTKEDNMVQATSSSGHCSFYLDSEKRFTRSQPPVAMNTDGLKKFIVTITTIYIDEAAADAAAVEMEDAYGC